jgi:RHH-type rel operon transcriptional repressor/antitoxin RelB
MSVRVPGEIKTRLDALSERTGRSGAFYIRRALEEYLEDLEDVYAADEAHKAWEAEGFPTRSWDEMKADLGL